ncbi:hypothetical protein APHCR_0831 [Anaplasma phagocytophilum str. CR1007]|uniref:Uncharacterized protein n=10 Tax=Anaplasma phagocytophilum TaxID=948 RepID=A0A098EF15_ANAPH|nr:hypothetical protein YYU_05980 [Anaplasma phagocytophilum str. HZ2]AGR80987.1 hypothetical protein WSQ_06050 [Anaplasma phagocytophilum str. JM]AGR82242.1 hypothetical protein YYY_06055 [Anaplasma phagocytophilum str. Dog2]ANC34657.1 hypothetical protein P029_05105 [Anaplasma phagocytophilum str. Norway variant2]EOA61504.1 hypothetical protein HGE1_05642 [Anaplasma phagocytophilum str. HGE1]EOA62727.1 hypothetical protein CRT38_05682 [Anaplasma phagocytophilum str. CRT38]KDB55803.1 hypothe
MHRENMNRVEPLGEFDVEIQQLCVGSCVRYCGRVNLTVSDEFSGIFWLCGGLGAFESFSGKLFVDDGVYRASIDCGERQARSGSINLKQVNLKKDQKVLELIEVDGGKTSLILRRV